MMNARFTIMISQYQPDQSLNRGTLLFRRSCFFLIIFYSARMFANNLNAPGTPAGNSLNQLMPEYTK